MSNVSGYGGNLTFPVRPYLFNTVTAADMGYYTDSITGKKNLILKKDGIQIPFVSGSTVKTVISPLPGEYKSVRLVVNPACPCEDCNYEYGIVITKKVKRPGVGNSDYYPTGRFYGDKLHRIGTCSNGIMAAADIAIIENEIMSQITADTGGGMENSTPAIVGAKKYYLISDDDDSDASVISVTHGGATVTVTSVTAAFNLATVFNAQANVNAKLVCYQYDKTGTTRKFLITSIDDGYEFTIAAGTDTSIVEKGLLLTAKNLDIQFEVEAQLGVFEVKNGISLTSVTGCTYTNVNQLDMRIDGTRLEVPFDTNLATSVAAINTAQTGKFGVAAKDTTMLVMLNPDYADKMTAFAGVVATDAVHKAADFNHSSKASFPFLTPDDVFVEFSQLRHLGGLLSMVHDEKPIKDVEYVKINISYTKSGHAAIHGASHGVDYKSGYTLYIRKSVYDDTTAKWATAGMEAGTDISLQTMIGNWYSS